MNLENHQPKKPVIVQDDLSFDDFDFKPLTSGLGFHQTNKTVEVKSVQIEKPIVTPRLSINPQVPNRDNSVYQNDLSLFYGRELNQDVPKEVVKPIEKTYQMATSTQRLIAYVFDLGFILSCLGIILTIMSRAIEVDLMSTWSNYPNEITPLVVVLFSGFYLIYFSIFEKTSSSTIGKSFLNLRVVNLENKDLSFIELMGRTLISLLNFVSLGLFSYFDLQNKITNSKVIKLK